MSESSSAPEPVTRAAAWGVHLYTALGLPLGFLAAGALWEGEPAIYFLSLWVATIIDSTDGALARKLRVKEVLPGFDGRRLDDIVDYLMFVFLPALGLPALGLLPEGWYWVAMLPLIASGYGFAQEHAKTEESFVGFPSYWNLVVLFLYVLDASPTVTVGLLIFLSVAVFVPVHYIYPSRTRYLRGITLGLGVPWAFALLAMCARPDAAWAETVGWIALIYPVYYVVASLLHHRRVHAEAS